MDNYDTDGLKVLAIELLPDAEGSWVSQENRKQSIRKLYFLFGRLLLPRE